MNFGNIRSRLKKLEAAKPSGFRFDWNALCGISPPENPDAEVYPGCGYSWVELEHLPPVPDPLAVALARLHALHPKPSRPTEDPTTAPNVDPAPTTPSFLPAPEPFAPENDDGQPV